MAEHDKGDSASLNSLLDAKSAEGFISGQERAVRAILFTKKAETPGLWLRLAEALQETCSFGEVRHGETELLARFSFCEDALPKIVAITGGAGNSGTHSLTYEGPVDFDLIRDFLTEVQKGAGEAIELRRETERLRTELEHARKEAAHLKMGQVGAAEAIRKSKDAELVEARERAADAERSLKEGTATLTERVAQLEAENSNLRARVAALEEVQQASVLLMTESNAEAFLLSRTRPLKAVLFTAKPETPPLWQQLAGEVSASTAFAVVRHVEEALLKRFELSAADLPRICIFPEGGAAPVVYDGPVNLESLQRFLSDMLAGGAAAVGLRQQMHSAMREVEALAGEVLRTRTDADAAIRDADAKAIAAEAEKRGAVEAMQAQLEQVSSRLGAFASQLKTSPSGSQSP